MGLVVSMTTSVFATNLLWVLLLVNWVVEWNWKEKFSQFRQYHLLHAFLVMAAVHLVWLFGTSNLSYGLFDLQKKLPLLAIPLVVLTSKPLGRKELFPVAAAYCLTVITVSFVALGRYLTIPDLPYRNLVPHISHIRFSLNVCLVVFIILYAMFRHRRPWLYAVGIAVILWFLFFLMLIHSYTAYIILVVTSVVLLIAYGRRMPRRLRRTATAALTVILLSAGALAAYYLHDYYRLRPLSAGPLPATTANGNPYLHRHDGLIENGNYVHLYVCEKELRQEWSKVSDYPFDSVTPTGYTVYPALLRYLGAMGYTKDSLGMTHLGPTDIAAIEKGIANPVYLHAGPRKLFYVLFYEFENFRCYRSVSNFSVLQRLELWRNAWQVFLRHPLFGVGTGDVADQCRLQMEATHSPLADSGMHTHCQYLNFLLAFGLVGFLLILLSFVRAIRLERLCRSVLFTALLCIVLISFISEDTLETLAGITFVALGLTILKPCNNQCTNTIP